LAVSIDFELSLTSICLLFHCLTCVFLHSVGKGFDSSINRYNKGVRALFHFRIQVERGLTDIIPMSLEKIGQCPPPVSRVLFLSTPLWALWALLRLLATAVASLTPPLLARSCLSVKVLLVHNLCDLCSVYCMCDMWQAPKGCVGQDGRSTFRSNTHRAVHPRYSRT